MHVRRSRRRRTSAQEDECTGNPAIHGFPLQLLLLAQITAAEGVGDKEARCVRKREKEGKKK